MVEKNVTQRNDAGHSERVSRSEEMSDARLDELLAAVGNHEAKALVLIGMQVGAPYTNATLHRRFVSMHNDQTGWQDISGNTPWEYVDKSFEPNGLVHTTRVVDNDTRREQLTHQKTRLGVKEGDALAGHLLAFSLSHPDISLQQLLGTSQPTQRKAGTQEDESTNRKAPFKSYMLFKKLLASSEPFSIEELSTALGTRVDKNRLLALDNAGIINFQRTEGGKAFVKFVVREDRPQEPPPIYMRQRGWTARISNVVLAMEGQEITSETVLTAYMQQYPATEADEAAVRRRISGVLTHLAKTGYVKKDETFSGAKQTRISVDDSQREVLAEFVSIIDLYRSGDEVFRDEGRDWAREIAADPATVAKLAAKAKENSATANAVRRAESVGRVREIILAHGDGITTAGIYNVLKRQGHRVSAASVMRYVRKLQDDEGIGVLNEGVPAVYGPPRHADVFVAEQTNTEDLNEKVEEQIDPEPVEIVDTGEPLSNGVLADYLAGFGNHEAKAILLALMKPEEKYSRIRLYRLFADSQAGFVGWQDMSESGLQQYCKLSLAPISMVVKQDLPFDAEALGYERKQIGYAKTEKGGRLGDALAGHLLAFSERHEKFSLQDVFGMTACGYVDEDLSSEDDDGEVVFRKKRVPFYNYRLFKALLGQDDPMTETEAELEIGRKVPTHRLFELQSRGVIVYASVGSNDTSYVTFGPNPTRPVEEPIYSGPNIEVQRILDLAMVAEGDMDSQTILDKYIERYGQEDDTIVQKQKIVQTLDTLAKRGYLVRKEGFQGDRQTAISLTDEQREVVSDVVAIIDRFQSGDPEFMREGRRLAAEITSDPERVAKLAAKAKEKSKEANTVRKEVTMSIIDEITAASDEPMTANEIQEELAARGGTINREATRQIVRVMREKGRLRAINDGVPARYVRIQVTSENEDRDVSIESDVEGAIEVVESASDDSGILDKYFSSDEVPSVQDHVDSSTIFQQYGLGDSQPDIPPHPHQVLPLEIEE